MVQAKTALANFFGGNAKERRRLLIQLGEYIISGAVWFWLAYVVFAICYSLFHWNWLWAKVIADAIGWTTNFFLQRYWAFNNPRLAKQRLEVTGRYIAITLFNFLLDYILVATLKHNGVSPYIGFFVSAGAFSVWNYLWYRFWVFKPR